MRALVFLLSLFSVSPAFAATHKLVPASELSRADARAFSLESINLVQAGHQPAGNCDAGDNPMICPSVGPFRSIVQVTVGYTNEAGEAVSAIFNLPASSFTARQLREIAAGASVSQYVALSVKQTRKTVSLADERCSFGELAGSMTCEAPGRAVTKSIAMFDLAVSAL